MGFVRSDPKRLAEALTTETEESCTTYNMLKHLGGGSMEVEHQICNAWLLESSHGQQAPPDVKGIGALLSLYIPREEID